MSINERVYNAGVQVARPLLRLATPFSPKLRAGVMGRRGARDRLIDWAEANREPERPLVWLHAPSVGESLMALAIIGELRSLIPNIQIAFTHFSPSATRMADGVGADVHDFMPWDVRGDVQTVLRSLKPDTIAFVRTEIWPALVREATRSNIRTCLVNAVLAHRSSRLRNPARWLLQDAYAHLDAVGAVARDHAERFP